MALVMLYFNGGVIALCATCGRFGFGISNGGGLDLGMGMLSPKASAAFVRLLGLDSVRFGLALLGIVLGVFRRTEFTSKSKRRIKTENFMFRATEDRV